jgi:hypothetical protein
MVSWSHHFCLFPGSELGWSQINREVTGRSVGGTTMACIWLGVEDPLELQLTMELMGLVLGELILGEPLWLALEWIVGSWSYHWATTVACFLVPGLVIQVLG